MAAGLKVTYRRSAIGQSARQRATLRSLGLRRLGQSRILPDTPVFRGMVERVRHLVEVVPVAMPEPSVDEQGGAQVRSEAE